MIKFPGRDWGKLGNEQHIYLSQSGAYFSMPEPGWEPEPDPSFNTLILSFFLSQSSQLLLTLHSPRAVGLLKLLESLTFNVCSKNLASQNALTFQA